MDQYHAYAEGRLQHINSKDFTCVCTRACVSVCGTFAQRDACFRASMVCATRSSVRTYRDREEDAVRGTLHMN